MTHRIATLHPTETVAFDHATLAALCASEGLHAEETISKALTEIEQLIAVIATQDGYIAGLKRSCLDLRRAAGLIGMTTIRDGAVAVLTCIDQNDYTALSACTARLVRLGEPKRGNTWAMRQTPDTVA